VKIASTRTSALESGMCESPMAGTARWVGIYHYLTVHRPVGFEPLNCGNVRRLSISYMTSGVVNGRLCCCRIAAPSLKAWVNVPWTVRRASPAPAQECLRRFHWSPHGGIDLKPSGPPSLSVSPSRTKTWVHGGVVSGVAFYFHGGEIYFPTPSGATFIRSAIEAWVVARAWSRRHSDAALLSLGQTTENLDTTLWNGCSQSHSQAQGERGLSRGIGVHSDRATWRPQWQPS